MPPPTDTLSPRKPDPIASPDPYTWNPEIGLWSRSSPGHTRPVADLPRVHSGVESAVLLHALIELDAIDKDALAAALKGLLNLQVTSGSRSGCFR